MKHGFVSFFLFLLTNLLSRKNLFSLESSIEIVGKLQKADKPITGCTVQEFEMFNPDDIVVLAPADPQLPIQVNQLFGGGKPVCYFILLTSIFVVFYKENAPDFSTCLQFRSLDLRVCTSVNFPIYSLLLLTRHLTIGLSSV